MTGSGRRAWGTVYLGAIALYLGLVGYGAWLRPVESEWSGIDLILLAAPWTLFARIFGDGAMFYAIPVGVLLNTLLLYRLGRALRPRPDP